VLLLDDEVDLLDAELVFLSADREVRPFLVAAKDDAANKTSKMITYTVFFSAFVNILTSLSLDVSPSIRQKSNMLFCLIDSLKGQL